MIIDVDDLKKYLSDNAHIVSLNSLVLQGGEITFYVNDREIRINSAHKLADLYSQFIR